MRRSIKLGATLGNRLRRAGGVTAGAVVRQRRGEGEEHRERQERALAPPPQSASSRHMLLAGIAVVTVIEAVAVYVWLRLHVDGHPWWGLVSLVVGEVVETALLKMVVDRGGRLRWGPMAPAMAGDRHFRRLQKRLGVAGNAEVAIWVLWLAVAEGLGQPVAAAALLVLMHVKHQAETAAVRDTRFSTGLFSTTGTVGSVMEVAGAVACLALIYDNQFVLAAVAVGVGLAVEHLLLIDVLNWELKARDIRLPRDDRWRSPWRLRRPLMYAASHLAPLWKLVERVKPLQRLFNRVAINTLIAQMEPRPNPLSTMAPYTSWASLTDRTFSARHLPPVAPDATRPPTREEGPPTADRVAELFLRDGEMIPCPKSTVLFTCFAQWFTDGFLRTSRERGPDGRRSTQRNESNHEIDLAQLYGLNVAMTAALRAGDGLLKSQTIDGEEYPEHLCLDGSIKPQFTILAQPLQFDRLSVEQMNTLFAMGSDTRNLGFVAFNVLFLREHNRIARRLGREYPGWDGDRVFATTRSILTVILLKIVVEEYINHINPAHPKFRLAPDGFPNEPWHRPNWMAIEFNLLYRWHSLVPSEFLLGGGRRLTIEGSLSNSGALTAMGLGEFMTAASSQPAGRIGLFNTDRFLVEVAEKPSIRQGRDAALASYNDYRRLCRLPPVARFDEISSDERVRRELAAMYDSVEDVEFYVGLFAEEAGPNEVLPPLMMTMVAADAFSQALTNPLVAPRVFNEQTFSPVGMEIIASTTCISDLVHRNVPYPSESYFVSLTRPRRAR